MDQPLSPAPTPAAQGAALVSVSQLLRKSWQYYTGHFGRLMRVSLLGWVIIAAAAIIASTLGVSQQQTQTGHFTPGLTLGLVIYFILVVVVTCWQYVALIYAVTPEGEQRKTSEVYLHSKRWFWSYLWASIATGIIVVIGFILLVIPGIIFATWFSLSAFAIVHENLSGIKAMKASRHYVKGHFSAVLLRWLVVLVIGIVLSLITGFLAGVFGNSNTAHSIFNLILSLLLTPFIVIYADNLYHSLHRA